MSGVSEAKAALERGKCVVLVLPPAAEHAGIVWELAPAGAVIVCADAAAAADWVAAAPADRRVHPVSPAGLTRTARLLKGGDLDLLAGGVTDLAALLGRSALKLADTPAIVVAWPEGLAADERAAALDTLLSEAGEARRIILTWNPGLLTDFLERQAHRAPVVGDLPIGEDARPLPPIAAARYAIVAAERRLGAVRDALDAINPPRAFVWTPDERHAGRLGQLLGTGEGERGKGKADVEIGTAASDEKFDAVLCARVPSREQFSALSRMGPVVVLISGGQLPYLKTIAAPLTPLRLPTAADGARDRVEALRGQIATLIESGAVDAEVALLDPLFARFDPAEVAGALLAMQRETGSGKREEAPPPVTAASAQAWQKVFINVGKKDRVGAKDLVGALLKEVRLAKGDVGRIDVKDTFSVVEIAPPAVDTAIRGLASVTIRSRRVQARRDRER